MSFKIEAGFLKTGFLKTHFKKDKLEQANGFRSMLRVVGTLVRHCSDIMETVRHQLATLGYVAPEVAKRQRQLSTLKT